MALHDVLRDMRTAARLSQVEVAAATGIDQATLSRIEHGRRLPTVTQLHALAQALNTSMDVLVLGMAAPRLPPCHPSRCPYLRELTTLLQESTARLVALADCAHPEGRG